MIVELITTGSELLLGEIVNTNSAYLSSALNQAGFDVVYHSTVGDNRTRMRSVMEIALERADIVITSGGLGPTLGDFTKEVMADLLGLPLCLHEPSLDKIKCFFAHRHTHMPVNNKKQAMVPEGSYILNNSCGTAPGIVIQHNNKVIIHLPGPPHELKTMVKDELLPYLSKHYPQEAIIVSKELHTYGLGESTVDETLRDILLAQSNPTIALLARPGEILVRITAKANNTTVAEELIADMEKQIRARLGNIIFSTDDKTMEEVVAESLLSNKKTIALAESCTGGLVTSRLTDVRGASAYLIGSVVCYSNDIKEKQIGVPHQTLLDYGAVSEPTARAMAEGVRRLNETDIGVGVTGIAGPDGGTPEKPVGTVYIAVADKNETTCRLCHFTGNRTTIKRLVSQAVLNEIRNYLNR
ncbi:MAG: competence/damage-inducible protein A [Selenomonadales bacterium]|nr:competence/damage-inducible protein A [Selenomonadales bacterium]